MTVFRTPRSALPARLCCLLCCLYCLYCLCYLCCYPPAAAAPAQPTLRLASLEWLPYAGRHLAQGSLSGALARQGKLRTDIAGIANAYFQQWESKQRPGAQ
jgi:hypothetical protein